jgi:hypothetical protein
LSHAERGDRRARRVNFLKEIFVNRISPFFANSAFSV